MTVSFSDIYRVLMIWGNVLIDVKIRVGSLELYLFLTEFFSYQFLKFGMIFKINSKL